MDWLLHQLFGSKFEEVEAGAVAEAVEYVNTNPNASETVVAGFIVSKADAIISPVADKVAPSFAPLFILCANAVLTSEADSLYNKAIAELDKEASEAAVKAVPKPTAPVSPNGGSPILQD